MDKCLKTVDKLILPVDKQHFYGKAIRNDLSYPPVHAKTVDNPQNLVYRKRKSVENQPGAVENLRLGGDKQASGFWAVIAVENPPETVDNWLKSVEGRGEYVDNPGNRHGSRPGIVSSQ